MFSFMFLLLNDIEEKEKIYFARTTSLDEVEEQKGNPEKRKTQKNIKKEKA